MINNKKIALVACVKGREDRVQDALDNYSKVKNVDEIIVVDWNSEIPINSDNYNIPNNITIHRIINEDKWILSHAYNFAVSQTTADIIIKMDIDYRLDPDFLDYIDISHDNTFYIIHMRSAIEHWNGKISKEVETKHLSGFVIFYKNIFDSLGGYDERFIQRGHDDHELYLRFRDNGIRHCYIRLQNFEKLLIHHVYHGRTRLVRSYRWLDSLNRAICKDDKWSNSYQKITYEQIEKNIWKKNIDIREMQKIWGVNPKFAEWSLM